MGVCSYCGTINGDFLVTQPLGHLDEGKQVYNYDLYGTKEAGCGSDGKVAIVCSRCNGFLRYETVPATGNHNWVFDGIDEQFDEDANKYYVDVYKCSGCRSLDYRNRRPADD